VKGFHALTLSFLLFALGLSAQERGRGPGPQTVPDGGFFFVQLSDPQFGFSNNDVDFVQDTANAEFAVATVNRLKPAFVVVTGDLVNKAGDAAQIASTSFYGKPRPLDSALQRRRQPRHRK
jgi:hypothetical protein